jgi:hypothetical protein
MTNLRTLAMIAVAITVWSAIARAADPACAAPPYGSAPAEYTAFVDTICEAKLSHAPNKLEPLHNLGISNREIDAMTMSELRMRTIREIRLRLND